MKILLAIDASPCSGAAIAAVAGQAWPPETVVRVMHVIELAPAYTFTPEVGLPPVLPFSSSALERVELDALGMVAGVARSLGDRGLTTEWVVREGDPKSTIIGEAAAWQADLIMMGSHGRTGLARLLMGSVAQWVVAHAPCSVEVAREHPQAPLERHGDLQTDAPSYVL